MTTSREDVARRAYELFVARGAGHGRDLDDWLEAERQLAASAHADRRPNGQPRMSATGRMTSGKASGVSVAPRATRSVRSKTPSRGSR